MTHFPVTNSNLSAPHLAAFVQDRYSLSDDVSCSIIKAGINDTYLLKGDNQKYVFRVYSLNWRTKEEIDEEIRLLELLHQHNISVSHAVPDKLGNYIQVLPAPEGDRFAVLFTYAEGKKLHNYPAEAHYKVGVLMARMHELTTGLTLRRVSYTPELMLVDSLKKMERFLPETGEDMKFLRSAQPILLSGLAKADSSRIRHGVVHLDIWFDNLGITDNETITIFDFDFCGNGWIVLDLAYYILQINNLERDTSVCKLKVDSFMEGYQSVSPVTDEEKKLIPMLGVSLYYFYLGIQCERYDNWSNSFLNESYLNRFIMTLVKRYFDLNGLGAE